MSVCLTHACKFSIEIFVLLPTLVSGIVFQPCEKTKLVFNQKERQREREREREREKIKYTLEGRLDLSKMQKGLL